MHEVSQAPAKTGQKQEEDARPAREVLTKQEGKALAKKFTEAEVLDFVRKHLQASCDPDLIFARTTEQFGIWRSGDNKKAKKGEKAFLESAEKSLLVLGLENHYALAETICTRYRSLVIEIARQIEKEYDCKTPSEKVLAEMIAGAYGKIIEYSAYLNNSKRVDFLSAEANGYYTMFSKEVDRAHRQLITALIVLRQMKSPPIEFNVKAKTAFVAQNQQVNIPNQPRNENIDPK